VVRTAKKWQRPDGSVVKFDDNACDRIKSQWCRGCGTADDEVVEDFVTGSDARIEGDVKNDDAFSGVYGRRDIVKYVCHCIVPTGIRDFLNSTQQMSNMSNANPMLCLRD
jgi:hypothetical protein